MLVHASMCTSIWADRRFREARAGQGQTCRLHLRRSKYRSTAISISRTIISSARTVDHQQSRSLNIRRPLGIDVHGRKPPRQPPGREDKSMRRQKLPGNREIDRSIVVWWMDRWAEHKSADKEQHVRPCMSKHPNDLQIVVTSARD
jgi:hypothetical protein